MSHSLLDLRNKIEKMPTCHQIEILRILDNTNVNVSENKNGTFINLTEVPEDIIDELRKYTKYVGEQQETLSELEKEKTRIADTFFKGIKGNE